MTTEAKVRVLHVVESFGGGVLSAVMNYIASTPATEHHIAYRVRQGEYVPSGELGQFASATAFGESNFAAPHAIRQIVDQVHPTVVHAHSSLAGAFVRMGTLTTRRRRIVYTPHCYAFERRDIHFVKRLCLEFAEWCLAFNTDTVAACSNRELELAKRGHPRLKVVLVPNISAAPPTSDQTRDPDGGVSPRVVTTGRVSPQKDPHFFAQLASSLREDSPSVELTWIGAGDRLLTDTLLKAGVSVTGWLSRPDVWTQLRMGTVYVHVAAWEGFPLSILEAHRIGLPIVARRIPALADAPTDWVHDSPERIADAISLLAKSSEARRQNSLHWDAYLRGNSSENQATSLTVLYNMSPVR